MINPVAILFIVFCAVVGALVGRPLLGLAVGLAVVLIASVR